MLYCTDDEAHVTYKFTLEGKLLMTLGTPGMAAPFQGGGPFNKPTKVALDPKSGDLYVADGYGNSRIHKYSPDGRHLFSWGNPGSDPGEFNLVHSVCTDKDGYVYVADRENHRIQIFDGQGNFQTQWHDMHRPCGGTCCTINGLIYQCQDRFRHNLLIRAGQLEMKAYIVAV